jgi:hypothetical protein
LEILRARDSASISFTIGSGSRTVSVFMKGVYYVDVIDAIQNSRAVRVVSARVTGSGRRGYSERYPMKCAY